MYLILQILCGCVQKTFPQILQQMIIVPLNLSCEYIQADIQNHEFHHFTTFVNIRGKFGEIEVGRPYSADDKFMIYEITQSYINIKDFIKKRLSLLQNQAFCGWR